MRISNILKRSSVDLERPIFIWGTGRCGTYLIYDILSLHTDLCFPKWLGDRRKRGLWGDLHHGADPSAPDPKYGKPIEGNALIWSPAGLPNKIYEGKDLTTRIDPIVVISGYKTLSLHWPWDFFSPKLRILDKCPRYLYIVEIIDTIFPDAYHIFCIRDPRAVVNSILRLIRFTSPDNSGKAYGHGFFAGMYPEGFEDRLGRPMVENLCWQLDKLIRKGLGHRKLLQDRLIVFRYEELHNNVHEVVASLGDRLGLGAFNYSKVLPNRFPNFTPRWPAPGSRFDMSVTLCFSSDEMKYLDGLTELSEKLGYAREQPGRIENSLSLESW